MTILFNACLAACLIALIVAVLSLVSRAKFLGYITMTVLAAGCAMMTAYIGIRWAQAGRAPFSDMFESLVLFAWSIVLVYLALSVKLRLRGLDAASALLALLALAYASTFPSHIRPLMPALRSNWLSIHVFTCFLGYAGFAVSCMAAAGHLAATRASSLATAETRERMETIVAKTVSFGFLFLTLGIITGAVWANSAWGTYWSWDPKETWSLITWFVYAAFLHCKYMRGWGGRRAAWISIVGFLSVLFTYVGVNLLLSGLHSYG